MSYLLYHNGPWKKNTRGLYFSAKKTNFLIELFFVFLFCIFSLFYSIFCSKKNLSVFSSFVFLDKNTLVITLSWVIHCIIMYYEKNTHDLYFSEKNMCFTIKKRKKMWKKSKKKFHRFSKKFHRFFCSKKNSTGFWFHRFLKIPPVFSKISRILRKIPPVLKSSLGFQMTLCFQIKNLSGNFLWFKTNKSIPNASFSIV